MYLSWGNLPQDLKFKKFIARLPLPNHSSALNSLFLLFAKDDYFPSLRLYFADDCLVFKDTRFANAKPLSSAYGILELLRQSRSAWFPYSGRLSGRTSYSEPFRSSQPGFARISDRHFHASLSAPLAAQGRNYKTV